MPGRTAVDLNSGTGSREGGASVARVRVCAAATNEEDSVVWLFDGSVPKSLPSHC